MANSIKNNKPSKDSDFIQGYYELINESKYVGPKPIIYRSSWERKVSIYCDTHPEVIKWSSEPFGIKYFNILDQKYHTYYPDYYMKINRDGIIKEYLVEVKPKAQLKKPKPPKRKTKKAVINFKKAYHTYIVNMCKYKATKQYAKERGLEVLLLTEESWII